MKYWQSFKTWVKAKFGRIVTAVGAALASVDMLDISAIKDPLEGLLGHKGVQAVVVGLFAASWLRHQYAASKNPVVATLPPPAPSTVK